MWCTAQKVNMESKFDVSKIVVERLNDDEEAVSIIPAGNRTAWFRSVYPEGRISKRIAAMGSDSNGNPTITVECRVYRSVDDPEDNYLANAFATRSYLPNDPIAQHYQECAETSAKVRALIDAGFGLLNEKTADYDEGSRAAASPRGKNTATETEYDAAEETKAVKAKTQAKPKPECGESVTAEAHPEAVVPAEAAAAVVEQTAPEGAVKIRKRGNRVLKLEQPDENIADEQSKPTEPTAVDEPVAAAEPSADEESAAEKQIEAPKSELNAALDVVITSASAFKGKTARDLLSDEKLRQNPNAVVEVLKWIASKTEAEYAEEAAAAAVVLKTMC